MPILKVPQFFLRMSWFAQIISFPLTLIWGQTNLVSLIKFSCIFQRAGERERAASRESCGRRAAIGVAVGELLKNANQPLHHGVDALPSVRTRSRVHTGWQLPGHHDTKEGTENLRRRTGRLSSSNTPTEVNGVKHDSWFSLIARFT